MVPLIAVAHGSRDPRSARVIAAAVAALREVRPDLDVRLAFLDLNAPSIDQVLDGVAHDGHTHAVVVPMLLGNAFHARVDLPGLLAAAATRHPQLTVFQADVLGRDARLIEAVRERILEAGARAGRSVGRCRSCGSRLVRRARQCRDRRIGVHSPRRNQLVGRSNLFRDIRGTDSCPGDLRTRAGRRRTCCRRTVVLGSRPTDRSTQRSRSNCMSARAFRRHDRWALSTDRNDDRPLPTSR